MDHAASFLPHQDIEPATSSVAEHDANDEDDRLAQSRATSSMRRVDAQPMAFEADGSSVDVPEAWDRFPRSRRFESWLTAEDERLDGDRALTLDRADTLDRFVHKGSKRLLGPDPSPAWAIIVGAMVIAAWDAARRLSGRPDMCVAETRGGAPFRSVGAALRFAVYNEALLGVGPLSLVVAEDRDEDRIARARASRGGQSFITARQTSAGSTGGAKSQRAVELRCDVLRAISASKIEMVDLALLIQADVGLWRPADAAASERAVVDYTRWRLERELTEYGGGAAERLERVAAAAARRAEGAAKALATQSARVEPSSTSKLSQKDHDAELALADAKRRAELTAIERDVAHAALPQASDVGRCSAAVEGVRARLKRLPRTLSRVPGAMLRDLARHWGTSGERLKREAIEWRTANPSGPMELVRLKPAEIAARLDFFATDEDKGEKLSAQAIGRRIAASRRAVLGELARRGLVPRLPPRPSSPPARSPIVGYIPVQAWGLR